MKPLIWIAAFTAWTVCAQENDFALEEVIVTAQKKTQSLQETPISLTAFDEDRLEKDGIANLLDIGSSVPSMTIEPFPINNATLRIFIRGIGLIDAQITQDPPVGIYMDGVYIARSTGTALDVAELERIEVLRGPQGTLYGRNSTGGAINLITRRPSSEALAFKQTLTAGNYGLLSSKTSLNLPVSDTSAVKLAYLHSQKDGFVENDGPGGDFGDREVQAWRLDARWDISDSLQLDYSYDNSRIEFFNHTYQPVTPRPIVPPDPSNPAGSVNAQVQNAAQDKVTHREDRWSRARTAAPLLAADTEIEGHALTLFKDLGEVLQIKYIAAWRELGDESYTDLSGGGGFPEYRLDNNVYTTRDGSVTYGLSIPRVDQEQYSHELQFTGLLFDERVDYIAGLYYFAEQATEHRPFGHQFNAPISETEPAPGVTVSTSLLNLVGFTNEIDNTAAAVFGRATWTLPVLDSRLRLTLGARHSRDTREAAKMFRTENFTETATTTATGTAASPPAPLNTIAFNAAADQKYKDDSFELIGEFDISEDINVYAKAVEAYKSGGFNTRDPSEQRFRRGFEEEKVASIELGIKSELLQRRLRINANIFHSDYTDVQLNFLINNSIADTQVVNAGEATMQGLELDVTFMASRHLLLMLNYAYLNAEVTEAIDPDNGADVTDTFVFSSAPEHSYTAAVDYTAAEWSWGRLGLNLSYNYMGERNGAVRTASVPNTFLEDYGLINARLGLYDMPAWGGILTAALWGKNLADSEYAINAIDNLPQASRSVIWGEPRSYGLDLIYTY